MKKRITLLLIVILFSSFHIFSTDQFTEYIFTGEEESLKLNDFLYRGPQYSRGVPGPAEAEALLSEGVFQPVLGKTYFGEQQDGLWFLLPLNFTNAEQDLYLTIDNYFLHRIDLFIFSNGRLDSFHSGGTRIPKEEDPPGYANYSFPLKVQKGSYRFLFCISADEAYLPVTLSGEKAHIQELVKKEAIVAFTFGILLGFLLINTYFLIFNRSHFKSTLYFMLYLFSHLIYQAARGGYLNYHLWPDNIFLIDRFFAMALCLTHIFALHLLDTFLGLSEQNPKFHWFIRPLTGVLIMMFALLLVVPEANFNILLGTGRLLTILLAGLQIFIPIVNLKRSALDIRIFSISWIISAVLFILATLKAKGLLPYQHFSNFALLGVLIISGGNLIASGIRFQEISQKRKEAEEQLRRAGFQLMQNRNRPHFLMNTFNLISGLIRIDAIKAELAVKLLAGDFNYFTNKAMLPLVPLTEEIYFIKNYLKIMEMRFTGRLSYQLTENIRSRDFRIPPLSLQPLVENAIKYCDPDGERMRNISLEIQVSDSELSFFVTNPVMPGVSADEGETHTNILSRLKYHYPDSTLSLNIENGAYEARIHIGLIE